MFGDQWSVKSCMLRNNHSTLSCCCTLWYKETSARWLFVICQKENNSDFEKRALQSVLKTLYNIPGLLIYKPPTSTVMAFSGMFMDPTLANNKTWVKEVQVNAVGIYLDFFHTSFRLIHLFHCCIRTDLFICLSFIVPRMWWIPTWLQPNNLIFTT